MRSIVLNKLFNKKKIYLISYYKRQEIAFIKCYIRTYVNLEAQISQTTKSSHLLTKKFVSKYISIDQLVDRITKLIEQKERDYKKTINKKRIKRSIIINVKVFYQINSRITYKAIDIITKK